MNNKIESWTIEQPEVRIRLDQYIAARIPGESRSQIQNWIRKGFVRVNGETVKTGYTTRLSDNISLVIPPDAPSQLAPEDIPLDVLYEDSDLAVINKPAGLVCHAGAGIKSGTLVNALLYRMGPIEAGDPQRPGIVHRLDKLTSGVMIVAKNTAAHRLLSQQFKERAVRKEYLALVYGNPKPASGTIDLPLGRDPKDRKKISPRARKKRTAVTHYSTIEAIGSMAFLQVHIETGRTHQIRVHLAAKGHPIVGDALYGGNRNMPANIATAVKGLQRPFLHSHKITFTHPRSGERLAFCAPLPAELANFLGFIKS